MFLSYIMRLAVSKGWFGFRHMREVHSGNYYVIAGVQAILLPGMAYLMLPMTASFATLG